VITTAVQISVTVASIRVARRHDADGAG
jgi:hypothetical protein